MKTINDMTKEVIETTEKNIKSYIRKVVMGMLGFKESTFGDVTILSESDFIKEIEMTNEYKQLKSKMKQDMMKMFESPISVKNKAKLVSDIKHNVLWKLQREIQSEIESELTQQAMEIIKNDPEMTAMRIAAEMTKRMKLNKV